MANYNELREPRLGCLLHYDASASDAGAVAWLTRDPRCQVSYNYLILDSGEVVPIAPADKRAWHAGVCRSSDPRLKYADANSAFYGVSLAATTGDQATPDAFNAVVKLCRQLFALHSWKPREDYWRVVGHDTEAWPRGRKIDPLGLDPLRPVLSVCEVQASLRAGAP